MPETNEGATGTETNQASPDPSQPVPVRRPQLRFLRYLPTLILLGLAVHLILPQVASLEHSLNVIRQMVWWIVALAALAQIASYFGNGYLVQALVSMTGQRMSLVRSLLISLSAYSIGLVAGGTVGNSAAAYRWLKGSGISDQGASLAGTLPSLFNNLLLILLATLGLVHLLLVHELTLFEILGFSFSLAVDATIVIVVVWAIFHPSQLVTLIERLTLRWDVFRKRTHDPNKAQASVDHILRAWTALRRGGWRGSTLGTMLNTGFDLLNLYLVFLAAGISVSAGVLLTGYGLPLLLGKVGFLPGGVGIVEGLMVALYTGLGVPASVAVVAVLIYRLLSFWIPTLLGFPLAAYLERFTRKASATSRPS